MPPENKCAPGNTRFASIANSPPSAALDINVGASNPPDVSYPAKIFQSLNHPIAQ
jgi:hypothetical protein